MLWQERHKMFRDANRTHTRPATAVRNAKRLVQIEMADVRANRTGAGKADLRVHVRAIHVNLPAILVDDVAYLANRFLEDAVRAWIGDHQAAQVVPVLCRPGLEI